MTTSAHLTREQRIVGRLADRLPRSLRDLEPLDSRAQSLPAMLRRHGPVQVLLFLAAKGSRKEGGNGGPRYNDADLAGWLVEGISAGLGTDEMTLAAVPGNPAPSNGKSRPPVAAYAEWLAGQDLAPYLLRWEVAVETAGWLKMLIAARIEEADPKPGRPLVTSAQPEAQAPEGGA